MTADEAPAPPTKVVLALDQGTQSTRVYVFDQQCAPLASHQVPLPQIYPQSGWAEHDPMEIWRTAQLCIAAALETTRQLHGEVEVCALGITNQRETTVVWRRSTGQPLHNAIVWLDTRTSDLCDRLTKELGSGNALRNATGLPLSTYFSGLKWLWLLENVPEVAEAVEQEDACFGTVDSWLMWCLTGGAQGGVHVTDVTNASRTMLLELSTLQWYERSLELFRVPRHVLPRLASNSEVYGYVADGPIKGVPVSGCLGDQMAALLGQRCRPGEAKNTYGTGCFLLLNTGPGSPVISRSGLLTTVGYALGPGAEAHYALEGSVAVAGLGISWLRDSLCMIHSPDESEALAASVEDTGGCYLVPAFGGLLAPRWRSDARGAIVGLTAATTRAHVVRAMLEAICFQVREVLDAMRQDLALACDDVADDGHALLLVGANNKGLGTLRVDGGASANSLLMQLQSDLLQVPVARPRFRESTSLGAALAAGLAVGVWSHEEVFGGHGVGPVDAFEPSITPTQANKRLRCWNQAVERSLGLADLAPAALADEPSQHVQASAADSADNYPLRAAGGSGSLLQHHGPFANFASAGSIGGAAAPPPPSQAPLLPSFNSATLAASAALQPFPSSFGDLANMSEVAAAAAAAGDAFHHHLLPSAASQSTLPLAGASSGGGLGGASSGGFGGGSGAIETNGIANNTSVFSGVHHNTSHVSLPGIGGSGPALPLPTGLPPLHPLPPTASTDGHVIASMLSAKLGGLSTSGSAGSGLGGLGGGLGSKAGSHLNLPILQSEEAVVTTVVIGPDA